MAPGLWSIPVPLPINDLRYVLVYALETPKGPVLIDAGWDTADAWDGLSAGLALAGFEVADVQGVLVSHIHPDHYGLAARIREASGAWIALHPADASLIGDRYEHPERVVAANRALLRLAGVPERLANDLSRASLDVAHLVQVAQPDILIEDGQELRIPGWDLVTVWTPGHSPGHVCFHDPQRRFLFSGDHVLPRITPNVTVHTQQPPNPLADFLDSLRKLVPLAVDEVLPAHEHRFHGLGHRVGRLLAHHERRLGQIAQIVETTPDLTCWEIACAMPWRTPIEQIGEPFVQRSANGEVLAHLVLLESVGRVTRLPTEPWRWRPVAPHGH